MEGTKTVLRRISLGSVLLSAATAVAAPNTTPHSLKMRPRVAQATPDAAAVADDAASDVADAPADGAPVAASEATAPAPAPAAAPTAAVVVTVAPSTAAPAAIAAAPAASAAAAPTANAAPTASPAPRFILTGSLIPRASEVSPSPVTILRRDVLLAAGRTMIGDILQSQPSQGNAINAQNNNGGDGSTRINLRSLGANRTLTLLNGRRLSPSGTGADSSVDLNTIPLIAIDRVEILRDAGSTVYGSDAVGGVVNIITRTNFTGTEASVYTGEAERGDGFTYSAGAISGHKTDDGRGHFVIAAETQQQDPILAGSREFAAQTYVYDFSCTDEMAANGECDQRILSGSSSTPYGRIDPGTGPRRINIPGCTSRYCTADGNGGFRNYIVPTATSFGDAYNFQPLNYLYTPSQRTSVYAAGNYKVTSDASAFLDAGFQHRESDQQLAPLPLTLGLFGTPISADSIYNPLGTDIVNYNRRFVEAGPRTFEQNVDTLHLAAGIRGEAKSPGDWSWELSYRYSRSDASEVRRGGVQLSRLASALGPSYIDPSFGPTCGTPTAPISGCVPLDLLRGAGSASKAAVDYVTYVASAIGTNEQQTLLASAQRRIVALPGGGDVSLAVVADVREDKADYTPDPLDATGDTTGNSISPVHGSVKTAEVAAELQAVLSRDADGLERLELDVAGRAFRYDNFDGGINASARALLRPVRGITLRASQSAAFRAPSIAELFTGQADSYPAVADPCDVTFGPLSPAAEAECARQGVPPGSQFGTTQQRARLGGNPSLQPETAKVTTAGVVLESARLRGVSLSLDAWRIEVEDTIASPVVGNVFNDCYENGDIAQCDLIHRDPATHAIDFVDARLQNRGTLTTQGYDAALSVDQHFPGLADLHARAELQQLDSYELDLGSGQKLEGKGVYDLGVMPERRVNVSAVLQRPHSASAGFNYHFVDKLDECANNDCSDPSNGRREIDAYQQVDVFGSLTFGALGGETTLTVGVNNVFDAAPPLIYNSTALNADESAYDFLGRFTYARLTQKF